MRSFSFSVPDEALEPLRLLGKIVEEKLGLVYSDKRRADIWRSLTRTASARSESPLGVLLGLAGAPPEEELPADLVADLTVGETFFFRERKALRMFSETALPEIAAGKGNCPLRFWSAGCSTGEEPYTLSMLLLNALPGMDPEQLSVLGTDINPFALEKARKGIFRRWSFRGMAPEEIRLFFNDLGDGSFSVRERYRRTTAFSLLNLAERPWRLWRDGGPPDAVFCRNVLIYFSPKKREEVLAGFHSLLPEGGWLAVAACETAPLQASGFSPVSSGGVTLYRKNGGTAPMFFPGPFRFSDVSSTGEAEERLLSFEDFFSGGAAVSEEELALFTGNTGGEEDRGPEEPRRKMSATGWKKPGVSPTGGSGRMPLKSSGGSSAGTERIPFPSTFWLSSTRSSEMRRRPPPLSGTPCFSPRGSSWPITPWAPQLCGRARQRRRTGIFETPGRSFSASRRFPGSGKRRPDSGPPS